MTSNQSTTASYLYVDSNGEHTFETPYLEMQQMSESEKEDFLADLRKDSNDRRIFCPGCRDAHAILYPLVFHLFSNSQGYYYSHLPSEFPPVDRRCHRAKSGESQDHLAGKNAIFQLLIAEGFSDVRREKHYYAEKNESNVIPDVSGVSPDGLNIAVEIQRSKQLKDGGRGTKARHERLIDAGFDHVWWYLFPSSYIYENREYLSARPDALFFKMETERVEGSLDPKAIFQIGTFEPSKRKKVAKIEPEKKSSCDFAEKAIKGFAAESKAQPETLKMRPPAPPSAPVGQSKLPTPISGIPEHQKSLIRGAKAVLSPGDRVVYRGRIVEYLNKALTVFQVDRSACSCTFADPGRPRGVVGPDLGITTWLPIEDIGKEAS